MSNTSMVNMDSFLRQVFELDVVYLRWVLWLIYPIILSFLLPLMLLVFFYASVLFLLLYRQRHQLRDAYAQDFWDGARKTLAALWDGQGWLWHGYEVSGLEQIPESGPALIIYYHAVIPIDIYYIMAKLILEKGRQIRAVGDRFLFHIPGNSTCLQLWCYRVPKWREPFIEKAAAPPLLQNRCKWTKKKLS